jgi:hypothetical protein
MARRYAVDDRPWQGPTHPAVAYISAEDRKNAPAAEHLARFAGVLIRPVKTASAAGLDMGALAAISAVPDGAAARPAG